MLDSLVNEIIVDVALEAHAYAKRERGLCTHCGQRCVEVTYIQSFITWYAVILTKYISTSSTNGVKSDYYSNNPLFECLVCSRQVSSNRYATHLEKCMGAGSKAARKSSTRSAKAVSHAATQRILHENSRSSSPLARASSAPRKRAASPASISGNTENQLKRERTMNFPSNPPDTPKSSVSNNASISTSADLTMNSQPSTPSKQGAANSKVQAAASQGQEDDLFDENDFASGFSVSVCI